MFIFSHVNMTDIGAFTYAINRWIEWKGCTV